MMNQSVTCRKDYFASDMVLVLFAQIERETRKKLVFQRGGIKPLPD